MRRQQHARQDEGALRAQQQDLQQRRRPRAPAASWATTAALAKPLEIAEGRLVAGNHGDGAHDHHPAGRGHEAADHRIRNEADGAAGAHDAEAAQQQPGDAGRQRHHDQCRRQQVAYRRRDEALRHRGHQRGDRPRRWTNPARRSAKGSELRQATMAPATAAVTEGHGDAVGKPGRERAGKDERGVRQAIGD